MAKLAAYGTILKKGVTTIAGVKSVSGPGLSADTLDVTTHDSASAAREFVAGLIDAGEVTFELEFDPATASQTALITDLAARALATYSLTFPGGGSFDVCTFSCLVTKFQPNAPVDGDLTASVTLKLSGLPTWA